MIGEQLGRYRVLGIIGRGGMGIVYRAEHALIGHRVAIKVLLPEFSRSPELVQRFFNEALATTAIRHPSIINVLDFGHHHDGSAYIVMELLEGESLRARLERDGPFAVDAGVLLLRQLAGAVGAAHAAGIVHRDLKPDNLFLVRDADALGGTRLKVLDFGIAKLSEQASGSHLKTRTGNVMGTPVYMSPEQCRGAGAVDHRSDIYSAGCIAYEMFTGQPPFSGEGPGDLMIAHVMTPPTPPGTLVPMPRDLEALILAMLMKLPPQRPQGMDEVMARLDAIGDIERAAAPPLAVGGARFAAHQTTLGGTASQIQVVAAPRRRRRAAVVGGLLAAAAAAAIAIAIAVASGGADRPQPPASAPAIAAEPAAPPADAAPLAVSATDAAVSAPVATPPPSPEPEPAPTPAKEAVTRKPPPAPKAPRTHPGKDDTVNPFR